MSEETIMKVKLATILNVVLGILSIAVTFIGIWVGSVSSTVSAHDRDIATLKECTKNQTATLVRIEKTVDDIRNEQIKHEKRGQ